MSGIVVIALIIIYVVYRKRRKKDDSYGTLDVTKDIQHIKIRASLVEGLSIPSASGSNCTIILHDSNLSVVLPQSTYKLYRDQIVGSHVMTKDEIIQKSKSSIGRAVVGGVLLGPLGAVVGAISGVGSKTTRSYTDLLIITYKNKQGELSSIAFAPQIEAETYLLKKFSNKLNKTYLLDKVALNPSSNIIEL